MNKLSESDMINALHSVNIFVTYAKSQKVKIDKMSYFLTFNYNPVTVERIKELPIRYWHIDTKQWEIPSRDLDSLYYLFFSKDANILQEYNRKNYDVSTSGATT